MSQDSFTETSHTSLGGNIKNSFSKALIGIILFFASFFVLYLNEGSQDLSKIAKLSTPVNIEKIDEANNGKFINSYAKISSDSLIGDIQYLKPAKYLALNRNVEWYVWVEETNSKTNNNLGGSSDTQTTYNYVKKWSSTIPDSDTFKIKEGHENKFEKLGIENKSIIATNTKIGDYNINLNQAILPPFKKLSLDKNNLGDSVLSLKQEDYIYVTKNGTSTLSNSFIGDIRISWTYLANDDTKYTIIGKIQDKEIVNYHDEKKDVSIFRIFNSDFGEALKTLHGEYTFKIWLLRGVGFFMMWFGLMMIVAPLVALSRIIPFFGGLVNGLSGGIAFLIALVLSILTILISIILHNVIILLITLFIAICIITFIVRKKKK